MRHRALHWILGVLTAAIAGTTVGAAPAIADVTMTPGQAVRGEAAKLIFRVTEDRVPAYTTKIELLMPESAPVAETYPMSNPEWAPRITMRKVDQALGGIFHGQVSEVVASIAWTRAGAPGAGAAPAELVVSLGPVPQTDQMTFALVQTYSDGHVTNWNQPPSAEVPRPDFPAPVLTVMPPAAQPGPTTTTVPDAAGAEAPDSAAASGDEPGQGLGSLTTGLVVGLLCGLAIAGWLYLRRTRGGADADRPASTPTGPRSGSSAESGADASAGQESADPPTGDGATRDRAASGGRAWRLHE